MTIRNLTSPLTPPSLSRSLAISPELGLPRYWATVHAIQRCASLADKTARRKLNAIDALYRCATDLHDFRHTCAVTRLAHFRAAGVDESDALAKLRSFFGWTYTSEMPRLYARAYWERHMDDVWNDHFDAHVDALRDLEPGGWEG